jgi:hypothetical protein
MQQRRVRLGDILDDYCPRERRITNHAVVAMIEDTVKQTRCTTCDADHEYKHAKTPALRRKKPSNPSAGLPPEPAGQEPTLLMTEELDDVVISVEVIEVSAEPDETQEAEEAEPREADDEWGHRPLIRATLPRPEGQSPERKAPDFTIRQTGSRFDGQRNGNRPRGDRQARHAQGQSSGQSRFGTPRSGSGQGSRHGAGQPGNSERHGNRQGPSSGRPHGGGRPGHGGGGQRPGQGRGPKRGR